MARKASVEATLYFGPLKDTLLGDLWLAVTDRGLAAVGWGMDQAGFEIHLVKRFKCPLAPNSQKVREAGQQVREYLEGKRQNFTIAIDWMLLRPFQQAALQATCNIPYGETRTYSEIAHQIGRPRAARAIGRAEATNPMPLVIPCHRVIGADGKLHGYGLAEGLKTKEWLLRLEGALLA
ncbi:MAG: methylated-DNA--[protein]-cysteine S-methyltransferase [Anaerolineales bacterium]|nr:methylated-DNA--[protein]-cysteine S-methyltransferase [Anaerolineales bacterium]